MKLIIAIITGVTLLSAVLWTATYSKVSPESMPVSPVCKDDSLQNVID